MGVPAFGPGSGTNDSTQGGMSAPRSQMALETGCCFLCVCACAPLSKNRKALVGMVMSRHANKQVF
jgi:hypothetical protein